ncbi:hypothetical protein [Streptomyces sp. NBC_00354]|uniref:hypothetical protein n=1 Tax=Streptomyces sp. NBC_00354 TaxID=2975723 RepID=UPI002E26AB05|nr:hypothetical protein OG296_41310 [Streptomyces sp. NBC_01001]
MGLFAAHGAGASEVELQQLAAASLGEMHFRDVGSRADGVLLEFTDVDYIDIES